MNFETYNVYFSGEIMDGQDPVEVRQKIGRIFKLEGAQLEQLFSGLPVAIKKDVDMDQAIKYRITFREAGALVEIKPTDSAPPTSATSSTPPASMGPIEAENFTVSAPNSFDLCDCSPAVKPQHLPDISSIALDHPGVILDKSQPAESLVIDTHELALDSIGAILDDSTPAQPTEIDTRNLTLNPANEGSLEEFRQPAKPTKIPSIDHLKLEENSQPKGNSGKANIDESED